MAHRPIACVDFDGTIVEHEFPEIGPALPGALETLRELQERGWKLILYTCREDGKRRKYLTEAVEFLHAHGITLRSVNENLLEDDFREEDLRRKPFANVYIDDRNVGGFVGWAAVRKLLLEDSKETK